MKLDYCGNRVQYARNLTGLTRTEFCEKYGIPIVTMRHWENSPVITEKSALRLAQAINVEGIFCDPAWIISGMGRLPSICSTNAPNELDFSEAMVDENILEEVKVFQKKHKKTIYQIITDNTMNPVLHPGDYVAGFYTSKLENYLNHLCIVETISNQYLVRIIEEDLEVQDKFLLKTFLPSSPYNISFKKQEIQKIAKIVWIRKTIN